MNGEYDIIVCGSGPKEYILSALLSARGKRVLHVDSSSHHGGDCTSESIAHLYDIFMEGKELPREYGTGEGWRVDLVPKFVVSTGNLVRFLLYTNTTQSLQWTCVDNMYVYKFHKGGLFSSAKGTIHRVIRNGPDALRADVLSSSQASRCRNLFEFSKAINERTLASVPAVDLLKKFMLGADTVEFAAHSCGFFPDYDYLKAPASFLVSRLRLCLDSMGRFGNTPFLYPVTGLAAISESFVKVAADSKFLSFAKSSVSEIIVEHGKAVGIYSGTEKALAPIVICDPSYVLSMPGKVRKVGQIIRCICIMDHPIPGAKDDKSCVIVIPPKQMGRRSCIYITMVSGANGVCPQGVFIASVSANVETPSPEAEVQPALKLLGPVKETFVYLQDLYEPASDGKDDGIFVTRSCDVSVHLESAVDDALDIYSKITGEMFDLSKYISEEEAAGGVAQNFDKN